MTNISTLFLVGLVVHFKYMFHTTVNTIKHLLPSLLSDPTVQQYD